MADAAQPDLQAQLDFLRRKMTAAAERVEQRMIARANLPKPSLQDIVPGEEIATPHGRHWETTRVWEHHRRHGNMEIARLQDLPPDLLAQLTEGAVTEAHPETWAFLDTETTGLAGGAGTCAFLIGVGRITPRGFEVRQFFMRDYDEEKSQLHALTEALTGAQVLVTYNGKCFDVPLLETRYRLSRARPPFDEIPHLDLLFSARRLWRLRLDNCRLVELETSILGHEREGDIPGQMIPEVYFDWVRSGAVARLAPVFHHNALDIVSLACLTGVVPWAFRDPSAQENRHAAESVSLGRWLRQNGQIEQARDLFRSAIRRNLRDDLMFRTIWDLAELEKKLGAVGEALTLYHDLASGRNPFQAQSLVALAKIYEHHVKDYRAALTATEQALTLEHSEELDRRKLRLLSRLRQQRLPSIDAN
ncbi:MAG: ribonuclease H-like domain-containing protein [Bryobacteraceae bacterium]